MPLLNRVGNKSKIAAKVIANFPEHETYIELFFGAGGLFFNKPKAKYNILNDLDCDVYNLFRQVLDNKDELIYYMTICPITEKQFKEWQKKREKTDVMNAVRFLVLSNFSYMGIANTLIFHTNSNTKQIILDNIDNTFKFIQDCLFMNTDFRNVIKKISIKEGKKENDKCFIYCDPPYLGTEDNYSHSFKENDCIDLFQMLVDSKIRFAISEFLNPFILELAKSHNLNVIEIAERRSMKSRNTEILMTNYLLNNKLF